MGAALHAMMQSLGHHTYIVVGHDRGGRVAYRMALDYPEAVLALVSVTVVPTPEMWEGANKAFGMGAWHWFMLAQQYPFPETLLASDPRYFLDTVLGNMAGGLKLLDSRAVDEYRRAFDDADVRHAICEDYRAGASIDETDDLADRDAGRRLKQPVFVFWEVGRQYGGGREPLDIWRDWADNLQGMPLAGGHLLPEKAAPAMLSALGPFLRNVIHG
jgi:haloacetate dehalogenase